MENLGAEYGGADDLFSGPPHAMNLLTRRSFLGSAGAAALAVSVRSLSAQPVAAVPDILDAHTHFYDPLRAQGVPWPPPAQKELYRPVLPEEFKALTSPLGVRGTVVVEASSWLEDNRWVLDLADKHPWLLGLVGRLDPADPQFERHLAEHAAHPLFKGIRIGHQQLVKGLEDEAWINRLRGLADHHLAVDLLGPPAMMEPAVQLSEKIPALRMVLDHVCGLRIKPGEAPDAGWIEGMKKVATRRRIWCKISGLVEGTGQKPAPVDPQGYRPVLEALKQTIGTGRMIYASNWPVSTLFASYEQVLAVVRPWVLEQGPEAASRIFAENALSVYNCAWRS